jgi:uracil-DNA glycosylase family 4
VTNAVKCLPPQNKPETGEVVECNRYLAAEVEEVRPKGAILALGTIAHRATLLAFGLKPTAFPFAHGSRHALPQGRALFDSYHCSRYNTQTKRLTEAMFVSIFEAITDHLDRARPRP